MLADIMAMQTGVSPIWDRYVQALQPPRNHQGKRFGYSPFDVVYREGTLKLLRFRSTSGADFVEPILICFAVINRPYILDLHHRRSVVQQLLRRGFDVYMIDWGTPTATDCNNGLHTYICRFMKHAADFVCQQREVNQLNLLGYCMGGTMSAMYASLYQPQIKNLILLAAPIDFGGDESLLNLWTREEYFDVDGLID
ncbi:MAG: alpha/beta fold hydrolase, partial [Pirellulales bacterium]|nr:alpha/beta fold hydrolase [Pirellulales bacterium]